MLNLKNLFKAKYTFKKPEKTDILIFDKTGAENITKCLAKSYRSSILATRGEFFYITILLKVIFYKLINFKRKNYFKSYLYECIKYHNPKIIISFIDTNSIFFNLKKNFPKIKFICIQNGLSLTQYTRFPSVKIDYFLCYSEYFSALYKKKFAHNTKVIGSLKLNNFKYSKTNNKNKNIVFISQFKKFKYTKFRDKSISHNKFFLPEFKILPIIFKFCVKKKIKLIIAMRTMNQYPEKDFFMTLLKNQLNEKNKKYLEFNLKNQLYDSYRKIINSELVINIDSALGLESIGLKKKTLFLSIRSQYLKSHYLSFGWPKKIINQGFFWTNNFSEKKINMLLDKNYKIQKKKWISKLVRYKFNNLISYDYNNKKTKLLIKNLMS